MFIVPASRVAAILITCPHCSIRSRYDTSYLEDAIHDHTRIDCVACGETFVIEIVRQPRAVEQRDEAAAGRDTDKAVSTGVKCPVCDGYGYKTPKARGARSCVACDGTGHIR